MSGTVRGDAAGRQGDALRRSEERFRALAEAVGQAVWSWSAAGGPGDFETARRWWEELTGQPALAQADNPDSWLEVVHPDDRRAAANAWGAALARGASYDIEYRVQGRHGDWRHVQVRGVPIRDPDGSVREWVGTIQDVTESRTAGAVREWLLAEAQAERQRLEDVFRHAPSFMAVLRGPDHVFERVNDRYVELIGGRDVIGRTVREALPEIEGQGYFELLDEVYRTGEPRSKPDARAIVRHPEGLVERTIEFVYQPMRDAAGVVAGVLVQGIDLTERREAEAALARVMVESERQRRMFDSALSHTADFVYMFDADGRFTYVNKALLDLWGKDYSEAVGRNFFDLDYPPELAARLQRQIREVFATGRPLRDDTPYTSAQGTRLYEYIFVPVFAADGAVEAVAGSTRDLTDRMRSEEALREADRKKDDFIALLAHELRNPLAPIRNGLQVMRIAGGDAATLEGARAMMDRQLTHMVRLIDDLLDVSRVGRNKMELRRARVTLAEVVGHAVEAAGPAIGEAGHELTVVLPPEPIALDADLTRLAQVFSNLLTNSARYTPRGGSIWLTAERAGREVVVSVRDTGIGIPSRALPTIFDMFSQVDRSLERSTGGLGIGLALVKGLVEMHGGSVSAESSEGQGSTFTVRLPVAAPATEVAAASPEPLAAGGRRRVLVVDDNRDGAASMAEMLRLLGNEVVTAHDGLEALAVAADFRPEVILMDVGMPRLNGLEATRRIREEPWGRSPTIIALTGWGQDNDRARTRAAGCDGHLVKPVDLADLERIVRDLRPAGS